MYPLRALEPWVLVDVERQCHLYLPSRYGGNVYLPSMIHMHLDNSIGLITASTSHAYSTVYYIHKCGIYICISMYLQFRYVLRCTYLVSAGLLD